ncbi:HEAT repeat domain-containing protein [Penaeicola halotolerans]|uniref:HEAT repeat domain-containing protein n=1 Tax=Penaeicola halotolerans TaxID=2793196 RepID=UPI001CF88DCD|nr:HEAT repeat domain-containing protein [Penaeicola halotolerans]
MSKAPITAEKIESLFAKMMDKEEQEAFIYADELSAIGTPEILERLKAILISDDYENAYLAARAISNIKDNQSALPILLDLIHDPKNKLKNGGFVAALEGFDLSAHFVDIFRIYLFGNFKSSALAKEYLDYVEFDITPRTIRKAQKHWKHFTNNSNQDLDFEEKKAEVEAIFADLQGLFDANELNNEAAGEE